jgi:hypothetical protein
MMYNQFSRTIASVMYLTMLIGVNIAITIAIAIHATAVLKNERRGHNELPKVKMA